MTREESACAYAIIDAVAASFLLERALLLGRDRRAAICNARHAAMYVVRDQLGLSHKQIARLFNRMDHGSVINACQNVSNWLDTDATFRKFWVAVVKDAVRARKRVADSFEAERSAA